MEHISIKTPEDLEKYLNLYENSDENDKDQIVFAIGTYKWYNFYCGIHIKEGSNADQKNAVLFKDLEKNNKTFHKLIEKVVAYQISKLENDTY